MAQVFGPYTHVTDWDESPGPWLWLGLIRAVVVIYGVKGTRTFCPVSLTPLPAPLTD